MRLCRSLILVGAAVSLLAQSTAPEHAKGLPNFHAVNEHIYRGGQPTDLGLQALRAMGVRTVLDLRPGAERSAHEQELLQSLGIRYVNIPMPSLGAPNDESINKALTVLGSDAGWPVFVHCQRGADRTGTVVACYRMAAECWTPQRALEEAVRLGLEPFQTAKKHYILNWEHPLGERCLDHLLPMAPAAHP
jgi:protein tyrosine/serine phosphatase